MEQRKKELIEAAGKIIKESGIDSLTIDELAVRMEIPHSELSVCFEKDTDILKMMFIGLENEIQQLIKDVEINSISTEEEFQNLFKSLNRFLERKPFYMIVIFDKYLSENQHIINRIIKKVESYLIQLIDKGKHDNIFKSETKTRYLVNRILVSFRLLMNEKRVTDNMVRDIAILNSRNYTDRNIII